MGALLGGGRGDTTVGHELPGSDLASHRLDPLGVLRDWGP